MAVTKSSRKLTAKDKARRRIRHEKRVARLRKKLDYGVNAEARVYAELQHIFRTHFPSGLLIPLEVDAVSHYQDYTKDVCRFVSSKIKWPRDIGLTFDNPRLTLSQRKVLARKLLIRQSEILAIESAVTGNNPATFAQQLFSNHV